VTPNPDDLLSRVSEAERILDALLDLPPDERQRRAREICERDPELRAFVEPFLVAGAVDTDPDAPDIDAAEVDDAGTPLPIIPLDAITHELAEAPLPDRVGPFRILGELGRGGMGRVLLAVRDGDTPTPQCALKLLDTSRHSREELDRFARERETLSRLQHPHIARLYDSGVTAEGLPYLVMELVEGAPITRHCDAKGLDIEARLHLFRQICTAVEYAHSRLVIHRDLKPANVLVDVHGQVKLLDFGIAKWLEELDREAALTRTSHRVLTPSHAAPEQFRGEPITAATDVYQLGLLLYELLTGQRAHGPSGTSPSALERAALETDPERPSRVAVRSAARRLTGDLDAIVLKALRKEPAARYPTVEALRRDLDDYLAFRPVSARRGSRRYTLAKYVRRNRAAVAAAVGILVTSLAGVTGIILQMRATAQERDRVRSAEARASAINTFLVNELLTGSTPEKRQGRDLTLADVLGNAARGIEHTFRNQPETEADLRLTLARTYAAIGRAPDARAHADAALRILARNGDSGRGVNGGDGGGDGGGGGGGEGGGASAPEALRVRSFLGGLAIEEGKFKDARQALEQILARQRVQPGPAHPDTLRTQALLARSMTSLAAPAAAEALLREAVAAADRHHPGDWRLAAEIRTPLVEVLMVQTKGIEAEAVSREMIALQQKHLGPTHPDVLAAYGLLARTLTTLLKNSEAGKAHAEVVRLHEQVYGPDHPATADAQVDAAIVFSRLGSYKESFTLSERAYQTYRQRFGPEHPDTLNTLGNIGILYRRFGDDVKAEQVYREVYEAQRRTNGEAHPRAIRAGRNLNMLLVDTKRFDEARRVARDLVRAYETSAARPDADAVTLDGYAVFLLEVEPRDMRDPARALTIATRAVAASGRKHYLRLKTLAQAHAALGQPQQAIAVAREALALPGAIQSWTAEELLVDLLQKHGTPAEVEAFLLQRLDQFPRLGRAHENFVAKTMRHLARFYARRGRTPEAEQRYRDVLAQLRKTAPETDWEIGRAKSELGAHLAERRAFAEAEPLLVAGFETLLADTGVSHEQCEVARTRLVTLYEHWNRPEDARRWRARAIR
jgi:tetratricopeptide (TPR) repeat protein/tRNA A-37 threonylcarbamoyl transferase component Bud32